MPAPYLSEIKYLGAGNLDFVEVALDEGADPSGVSVVIYNPSGTVRTTNALGPVVGTEFGRDIYVIDAASSATFNGLHKNGAVALVQDGVVLAFYSFSDTAGTVTASNGPAAGMTSTEIGQAGSGESLISSDGSPGSYSVNTTPTSGSIPCFRTGTRILTPAGERPIEQLCEGDLVVTGDNGVQPIVWAGAKTVTIGCGDALAPVRVRAGAFGPGLPNRDLWVSPAHRVLMQGPRCDLLFNTPQAFASARSLLSDRSVIVDRTQRRVTYHHLLFARHQVIWSEGLPTESFHPGPTGLSAFDGPERAEVLSLFPELRSCTGAYGAPARPVLRTAEARLLAA